MQNMNLLNEQIQVMCGRILELYQGSSKIATPASHVLPTALKELGLASEELQIAVEELSHQNEALLEAQHQVASERSRYQHLFESAPDALVITSSFGIIQEINHRASSLFNRHALYLIGKPIASLVALEARSQFRTALNQIIDAHTSPRRSVIPNKLTTRFQRRNQEDFAAQLQVDVIHDAQGNACWLQWKIQDLSQDQRMVAALLPSAEATENQSQSFECYSKGEMIFQTPYSLWLVVQGVVKLTTLSDCGEDVLIGLASEDQVFGTGLTSLPVYQAIALSDVKLLPLPLTESQKSPELCPALTTRIIQRLQQAERFATMRGQLRVEDRLMQFLLILKEEIGERKESGTRLKVRLTHQDFANACCSTRVTMTRLLGKFQQEGKISFASQNYLVIHF